MPRAKFQTLTEQMFYILLCLKEECCGMDLMEKISAVTQNRVKVGPGTLYNLLEEFRSAGLIYRTKADGRRNCYILSEKGSAVLEAECVRLRSQLADFDRVTGGASDEG